MEVESLHKEVTKLKTEKAALQVKSRLFENFAAMAHTCCRLPSTVEWESLKNTLQNTLDFSIDMKFEIRQVQIEPGDILIGYTDGVIDALAPNGEFFTRKRLLSIIEQTPSSASDLVDRIKTSVSTHVHNAPPSDDITMLAVKRLALDLN